MRTLNRTTCLVIILFIVICWDRCSGWIKLCSDDPERSQNGATITAKLKEQKNISFCVESNPKIYSYITIKRPSYQPQHFNEKEVYINLNVHIARNSSNKSIVIISIKDVEIRDFSDVFNVSMHTYSNHYDILKLWFKLKEEDDSTSVDCPDSSPQSQETNQNGCLSYTISSITSNTSQTASTITTKEVARISTQITTPPTTPPTPRPTTTPPTRPTTTPTTTPTKESPTKMIATTPVAGKCLSHHNSRCPENWYTVDNKTCLSVVPRHARIYPSDQCRKLGARLPDITDVPGIKPCLEYLLQNTTVKVIRISRMNANFENSTIDNSNQYSLVCLLDEPAIPVITLFSVEILHHDPPWKVDLLNSTLPYVTVKETNYTINITCLASGNPDPDVRLYRDNVTIDERKPGKTLIRYAGCKNSGVYTCYATNRWGSSQAGKTINFTRPVENESFSIIKKKNRGDTILPGDTISMNCSLTGCPPPDVLSITDDLNNTLSTESTSLSLHYNIDNVLCSDMGTYYCRADSLEGQKVDLRIDGCPVQLCRGEDKTKIIAKNINQTVSFQICVISEERPEWKDRFKIKSNIQVGIEPRNGSSVYFLVNISINPTQIDNSSMTIVISNGHKSLGYEIKFEQENVGQKVADNRFQEADESSTDAGLVVGIPLVLLIAAIICVVAVIMYRRRAKRSSPSAGAHALNTSDSGNDDSRQVLYANLKDLSSGNSTQGNRLTGEQEVIIQNCRENEISSDITDPDSGRFISDEGLVYITVAQTKRSIKKKPKRTKPKVKEATMDGAQEQVEYVTIDFEKTGTIVISDVDDGEKVESSDGEKEAGGEDKMDEKKE